MPCLSRLAASVNSVVINDNRQRNSGKKSGRKKRSNRYVSFFVGLTWPFLLGITLVWLPPPNFISIPDLGMRHAMSGLFSLLMCQNRRRVFQLCHSRRQRLNTSGQAHINQRSRSRELLLLNIQSRSAKAGGKYLRCWWDGRFVRVCGTGSPRNIAGLSCHVCTLAGRVSCIANLPHPRIKKTKKTCRTSSDSE